MDVRGYSVPSDIYGPISVPERGSKSPYAYVEYWPEGSTHAHQVPTGGILELEEAATLLGEAIAVCNAGRHNGHGQSHESKDADAAFGIAIEQLLTKDFDNEHNDLRRKMAQFDRWGGHRPEFLIMPTDHELKRWELINETANGMIERRPVDSDMFDGLIAPQELGHTLTESPFLGHYTSGPKGGKKWSLDRRLRAAS